jgi:hypothetical protein
MRASHIFTLPFVRAINLALCTAALTACGLLSAQTSSGKGGPRQPPPEALAACKSLSSGTDCSFTSPHGAVTGTCWAPEGKPLACKPKDAPAGGPAVPKP